MKPLMNFLSAVLLLLLITYCSEPTEPQKEKETFKVVVTGTVNELTPSGSQPLAGCVVSLIAGNTTVVSQTDSNGVFLDTLITSDDTFRLIIDKAGFSTIDTVLQRNNVDFLTFIMNAVDVVVSGTVWEKTVGGAKQPSNNCRISIITSEDTIIIYSDQNGDFSRNITTTDTLIRLLLEKDLHVTIDTTIHSSSIQNLDFTLNLIEVEVTGRLYKTGPDGTFPFQFCEMKIYVGATEYIITTSDEGYFELITDRFSTFVRILIENENYSKLDTTFSPTIATELEFTLGEYVYFSPFTVGSSWTYDVHVEAGDFFYWKIIGEEMWEIIEVAPDTSSIRLKCTFNGVKIWDTHKYINNLGDTTYLYDQTAIFNLGVVDKKLVFSSCTGCENTITPAEELWYYISTTWYLDLFIKQPYDSINRFEHLVSSFYMKSIHPFNTADLIRLEIDDWWGNSSDYFYFTMKYQKGLEYIEYDYFDGNWSRYLKYNILNNNTQYKEK